ncbi:MAG: ABC transporter substrate-binding protein [Thermoplasmata archaeon]|nr:ABC transporter substrate-binding protein [Thermoplasmata archaeon]
MPNRTGALVIVAILVASAVFSVGYFRTNEKEPIYIGVLLSLTGHEAAADIDIERTVSIAADEINAMNKLDGRRIELIIRDCESDKNTVEGHFLEIEQEYQPVMYISALSSISIALSPLVEEVGVPLFAVACPSDVVTRNCEWVFGYYSGATDEIYPVMAEIESLNITSMGILHSDDEYGRSVLNVLESAFADLTLSFEIEKFSFGATDVGTQIQNISALDAIYVVGIVSDYLNILPQLKESGYTGTVFMTSDAASPYVRHLPEANGAYVSTPNIYRPTYAYSAGLEYTLKIDYNLPLSHQGAAGYDVLKMATGLLVDEEVSRENLRSLLLNGFEYSGVLGALSTDPGQHQFRIPLFVAQIVGGVLIYR